MEAIQKIIEDLIKAKKAAAAPVEAPLSIDNLKEVIEKIMKEMAPAAPAPAAPATPAQPFDIKAIEDILKGLLNGGKAKLMLI